MFVPSGEMDYSETTLRILTLTQRFGADLKQARYIFMAMSYVIFRYHVLVKNVSAS